VNVKSLFSSSGDPAIILQIIEALDTGTQFQVPSESAQSVYSMAEAFIRFLDDLPEPVVPVFFFQKCIDSINSAILAKHVISEIPSVNYNVFIYVTSFLRDYISKNPNELESICKQHLFPRIMVTPTTPS
jgi:hypothetical protein